MSRDVLEDSVGGELQQLQMSALQCGCGLIVSLCDDSVSPWFQ